MLELSRVERWSWVGWSGGVVELSRVERWSVGVE